MLRQYLLQAEWLWRSRMRLVALILCGWVGTSIPAVANDWLEDIDQYEHLLGFYGGLYDLDKKAFQVPPRFDEINTYVGDAHQLAVREGNLWGLMHVDGDLVVPPRFEQVASHDDGIAMVRLNSKWGLIDARGEYVLKPKYDDMGVLFWGGLLEVELRGKSGFINRSGQVIVPLEYDWVSYWGDEYVVGAKNGRAGVTKLNGEVVIPLKYDDLDLEFDDMGWIAAKQDGRWGYLTRQNRWALAAKYEDAKTFEADIARVKLDGKWGLINTNGDWVLKPAYDEIEFFSNAVAVFRHNGKWGLLDQAGKVLLKPIYEELVNDGSLLVFSKNGKWGAMDVNGRVKISPQFDKEFYFAGALAEVEKDGLPAVIDEYGHQVVRVGHRCGSKVVINADEKVVWPIGGQENGCSEVGKTPPIERRSGM